jgi:hypothetical protein
VTYPIRQILKRLGVAISHPAAFVVIGIYALSTCM